MVQKSPYPLFPDGGDCTTETSKPLEKAQITSIDICLLRSTCPQNDGKDMWLTNLKIELHQYEIHSNLCSVSWDVISRTYIYISIV